MTQPRDQISIEPRRPSLLPLMTSGDMYMGVPVIDFCFWGTFGRAVPAAALLSMAGVGASFVGWSVLFWRAMTFAAPKSTYLITPLWSSRMSMEISQYRCRRCIDVFCLLSGLISRWAMPL